MRVAVVGARRARQGTGPFILREFLRLGWTVPAIVGTSPESIAAAQEELRAAHAIEVAGYPTLEALLRAEQVDAVAICSPAEAHLEQLETALAHRCHVFCEKPLWWEDGLEADLAAVEATARSLTDRFEAADRRLVLNTQWPFTLPSFDALYPEAREEPLRQFEMWMSPISFGPTMLVDSGSHLLSMLHALAGPGALEEIEVELGDERLDLSCAYAYAGGRADVAFRLRRCPEPPRPVGFGVNGNVVHRRVDLTDYRIYFRTREQELRVPDPLEGSVEAFVRAVNAPTSSSNAVVAGLVQLAQLVAATKENRP